MLEGKRAVEIYNIEKEEDGFFVRWYLNRVLRRIGNESWKGGLWVYFIESNVEV